MSYRNPNQKRMYGQTMHMMQYAGQTATWRQYVSASAGVSVAGFGSATYYREQTITAFFGGGGMMPGGGVVNANLQRQTPMGQLEAGQIRINTQQRLGENDELVWNGVKYRCDTDSQPAPLNGFWLSTITRGDS